jgi:predicted TIM-barrel fold metal-dependent hydrolase
MTGNFELARALASAYNDWQIDNFLEKEPRLRGSVHVVAEDPEEAAREIDRVAEHPQIVQVFLPTVTDRQYGDPRYRPIFEAAVRNDLVVTLHHGVGTQTVFGYPRHFFEWHTLAAPIGAVSQLTSILCGGVFEALPDLKLVLLETGVAWVPWFMWRADEQYKELRMISPWMKRLPSAHIRDSVRVSTQPLADVPVKDFVKLVEMVEAEDVFMFATDYPHYDADSADKVLPATVPEALRNKICFQNALATYPRLAALAP